jgi:hypothetical protein
VGDEELRIAQRRQARTRSVEDEARHLVERLRSGALRSDRLEVAACCGHPGARLVVGQDPAVDPFERLAAWSPEVRARTAIEAVRAAIDRRELFELRRDRRDAPDGRVLAAVRAAAELLEVPGPRAMHAATAAADAAWFSEDALAEAAHWAAKCAVRSYDEPPDGGRSECERSVRAALGAVRDPFVVRRRVLEAVARWALVEPRCSGLDAVSSRSPGGGSQPRNVFASTSGRICTSSTSPTSQYSVQPTVFAHSTSEMWTRTRTSSTSR